MQKILYTSGTTGLPNGVVIDHHRILHFALGTIQLLKREELFLIY